jgi:hypothetical protein
MFENFKWPEPEEPADEKLIRDVREHGCHILNVHGRHQERPADFEVDLIIRIKPPSSRANIASRGTKPARFALSQTFRKIGRFR